MPDPRFLLFGYLLLMSLVLFAFMGADKRRAKRRAWLAALGGGLGGVFGMLAFRHKTKHAAFCIGMPLLMVLNFAVAYLLLRYLI